MWSYRENPKHKLGAASGGSVRWYPTSDSVCPEDVSLADAQKLLKDSVEGKDFSHPGKSARYALDQSGRFFKGYSEDGGATWHGYPVREHLVPQQVPSRVMREFVNRGLLTAARYRKLLGDAQ